MPRNARFWHYNFSGPGSWVKLTLEPGQALHHYVWEPTDEGWSACGNDWYHEGDHVLRETHHSGRDCDGRLDQYFTLKCDVYKLMISRDAYSEGMLVPEWKEIESHQRDEYAEMMGY